MFLFLLFSFTLNIFNSHSADSKPDSSNTHSASQSATQSTVVPWARCHALLIQSLTNTPFKSLAPSERIRFLHDTLRQLPETPKDDQHTTAKLLRYFRDLQIINQPLDHWLGYEYERTEIKVWTRLAMNDQFFLEQDSTYTFPLVSPELLLTPYEKLAELILALKPKTDELFADLGSGYSRLAVALSALAPQARYWGVEQAPERVQEARRILDQLDYKKATLETGDVQNVSIPKADYYFLFNPFNPEVTSLVIEKIRLAHSDEPGPLFIFYSTMNCLSDQTREQLTEVKIEGLGSRFKTFILKKPTRRTSRNKD